MRFHIEVAYAFLRECLYMRSRHLDFYKRVSVIFVFSCLSLMLAFGSAQDILQRKITFSSMPEGVNVQLFVSERLVPKYSLVTTDQLSFYRGIYLVQIDKEGYQSYTFQLDLIRDPWAVVKCTLAKEDALAAKTECTFE